MQIEGFNVEKGQRLFRLTGWRDDAEILKPEIVMDVQKIPAAIKVMGVKHAKWYPAKDFRRTKPEK